MKDTDIERIAEAIAAKLGEPGGAQLLGCGDASSSEDYTCDGRSYSCSYYECGGAGQFTCDVYLAFRCSMDFDCYSNFDCRTTFDCAYRYNE